MRLRNTKQLEGHPLHARDGVIGEVKDFYFDDRYWRIRYCVVEAGKWLASRRVLISPVVIGDYDSALQVFPVDLTTEQVRNSPDVDTDKPVSRQHEEQLRQYYGWPGYWDGLFGATGLATPIATPTVPENMGGAGPNDGNQPPKLRGDPFLRSVNDTRGYHIVALDGSIGHVEDFLIDDDDWRIRYLVVDTRNWWPGKRVIIAPSWIRDVSWDKRQVVIDLSRGTIKAKPPYEPNMSWSDDHAVDTHHDRADEPQRQRKH